MNVITLEPIRRAASEPSGKSIEKARLEVSKLCQATSVARLDAFGSAAAGAMSPDSEFKLLVKFDESAADLFNQYFDLKEGLESIFDRDVVLVMDSAIKTDSLRQFVDQTKRNLYGS